ncbi:MAG: hypothetical protein ACK55I_08940, partial [bacterium]
DRAAGVPANRSTARAHRLRNLRATGQGRLHGVPAALAHARAGQPASVSCACARRRYRSQRPSNSSCRPASTTRP